MDPLAGVARSQPAACAGQTEVCPAETAVSPALSAVAAVAGLHVTPARRAESKRGPVEEALGQPEHEHCRQDARGARESEQLRGMRRHATPVSPAGVSETPAGRFTRAGSGELELVGDARRR